MTQEDYKTCCFSKKETKEILLTKNPFSSDTKKRNKLKGKTLLQCLFTDPGYMVWLIYGTYPYRKDKVEFQKAIQKGIVILDSLPVVISCSICDGDLAELYVFDKDSSFGRYVCKDCLPVYKNIYNPRGVHQPLKIESLYERFRASESRFFANLLKEYMGFLQADMKRFNKSAYLEFVLQKAKMIERDDETKELTENQSGSKQVVEDPEPVQLSFDF